jgi:murein DD-endopeptidase
MTSTKKTPAQPRQRRGLLDVLLALSLLYGVYAKTPLGAVGETLINVARGQKDHPSWLASFGGRETSVAGRPTTSSTTPQHTQAPMPTELANSAAKHKVDADMLAALIGERGGCFSAGCSLRAPDALRTYAPDAPVDSGGNVPLDQVAMAMAKAQVAVGGGPLAAERALEALFIGDAAVTRAVSLARSSGSALAEDVDAHADYLTPSVRRGALQGALPVLYAHRLRTLAWPAEGTWRISSPFGERIHPVTGERKHHNGTDVAVPVGTPLVASHHGTVKRSSEDSISGTYLVLSLGLGIEVTYCHLSQAEVRSGEAVGRAQRIALSGATGRITGPHLHYILRLHGDAVDAEQYGESPTRNADAPMPLAPAGGTPSPG